MAFRQLPWLPSLLHRKPSRPIRALQILKPIHRNATRTRRKLQQATLLLCIPRADALPEMLDHLVILGVTPVVCVFLPVVDVDVGDAADEELKLALVEDID
jgi:hypothetical protein